MFQSSPTEGGRDGCHGHRQLGSRSFNPRPPLRVGATVTVVTSAVRESPNTFQSSPTAEGGRDSDVMSDLRKAIS